MFKLKEMIVLSQKEANELLRINFIYSKRNLFSCKTKEIHMIGTLYMKENSIKARVIPADNGCYHSSDGDPQQRIPEMLQENIAQDVFTRLIAIQKTGEFVGDEESA